MDISTCIILIVIGLLAGILSGLVGVGGGILAAMNYYNGGFVKWEYAAVIAFTFVVGGYFGSKLAISLPEHTVRKVFGVIMLIGALKLIFSK